LAAKHPLTAGTYFLHAWTYYGYGERFLHLGEKKLAVYRKSLECFTTGIRYRYPNIERVEVPYEGKMLPAWFMKAPNTKGPAPTVVFFNGLDGTKEVGVLYGGVELAARGINLLAVDGPGQGEALRLGNIPSRYDYEVAGTAAYECVTARPDVDPKRVAIMGLSMGGYYALRGLGRAFRLSRLMDTPPQGNRIGRHQGIGPLLSSDVGAGRGRHGCRDDQAQAIHASRCRGKNHLPLPRHARRTRHHRARRLRPAAV
jgi:hypothetical protein